MARNKYPEVTVKRILDASYKLFTDKGYDNTTIQDIVDELGDLSKGAIYHHFKSKEEIIEAVGERVHQDVDFSSMFDDKPEMSGCDKIKGIVLYCLKNTEQRTLMKASHTIMDNPKFLAMEVRQNIEVSAKLIAPYIIEGNQDGSLHVEYPEETAEIFMLLSNIWINPLVFGETKEKSRRKILTLKNLLDGMGFPVMDDEIIEVLMEFLMYFEK